MARSTRLGGFVLAEAGTGFAWCSSSAANGTRIATGITLRCLPAPQTVEVAALPISDAMEAAGEAVAQCSRGRAVLPAGGRGSWD